MKILLFSLDYLPNTGGIARMMSSIRAVFLKNSFEVIVITRAAKEPFSQKNVIGVKGGRVISEFFSMLKLFEYREHLILCARWYPEGLIAYLCGKKYVVFAHSAELLPLRKPLIDAFRERLKLIVLKRAVKVVSNSDYTNSLVDEGCEKVSIPLAVDKDIFSPMDKGLVRELFGIEEKHVLLSVSRIEEHKGHSTVFKLMASLPECIRNNLLYVIGGNGSYRNELQMKAKEYGVEKNVRWLGFVPESDLKALYNSADVFFLLSTEETRIRKVEGFGLSLVEAQSCGIPVIGSDSGGIPSAICHGKGGFICNTRKLDELSLLVEKLLTDTIFQEEQSNKARMSVIEYFNWDRYYLDLIRALNI